MKFFEKYRFLISISFGGVLCAVILAIWNINNQELQRSLNDKVSDTNTLIIQQFREVISDNVNRLENLKRRLEFTDGEYFEHWNKDAAQIVEQDTSFLFMEWIDSTMVIQLVEPYRGNEEAAGMDISKLNYRASDWIRAREDSVSNLTQWLELVQGEYAFLMDAPVYINGEFHGTVTAGMNFRESFDDIMQGIDEYYLQVQDEQQTVFYTHGTSEGTGQFQHMAVVDSIYIGDADNSAWTVTMTPNQQFAIENAIFGYTVSFILALAMCILLPVVFFFWQKSSAAERNSKLANEKLRALIDSAPIGIYVIDSNGTVVDFWNDAAEMMLGWKKEEVLGNFLPHVTDDHRDEYNRILDDILEQGSVSNRVIKRKRKDGSEGIFRLNVSNTIGEQEQMLVLLEDITKEKEFERQQEKALHEKSVLLAEIHHRVKNNLAIIVGIIDLHNDEVDDEQTKRLMNETKNRIFSISGVHELLYQTENFSEISFGEYFDKLIDRVQLTYQNNRKKVSITKKIDDLSVNINLAIPLGLLMNELITNSYKHAFGKVENPRISLKISKNGESIEILYQDNGKTFDNTIFEQAETLGMTLIRALLQQLNAEYELTDKPGFGIRFYFPISEKGSHTLM